MKVGRQAGRKAGRQPDRQGWADGRTARQLGDECAAVLGGARARRSSVDDEHSSIIPHVAIIPLYASTHAALPG